MSELPPAPARTVEAIYAAYEEDRKGDFRPHLGASQIGEDCERALWLSFRWASRARHTGRILRLFETGELEEKRLVANLRRIGVQVLDLDPATGRQWHVDAFGGHFSGSMDAVAIGVLEAPKTYHLVEFKTFNAKSFKKLAERGVELVKPMHVAQMQVYMHLAGLERALYVAVCKDDDAIHVERLHYDRALATRLLDKAKRIIFAPRPPEKISLDPESLLCRWCQHLDVCQGRETLPEKNCRTCLSSTPRDDGSWKCERWGEVLDLKAQKAGCPWHLNIPDLVPGMQVDAGDAWVEYVMDSGEVWRDGFVEVEVPQAELPF